MGLDEYVANLKDFVAVLNHFPGMGERVSDIGVGDDGVLRVHLHGQTLEFDRKRRGGVYEIFDLASGRRQSFMVPEVKG